MTADTTEPKSDVQIVASVDRALSVLDAFEGARQPLSLADLADITGLYKSTILRLLETMERRGYVDQTPGGRYQVGIQPFRLGALYQASSLSVEWISATLHTLVSQTGESASYHVRRGDVRVCLWRKPSPHAIRDHIEPGDVRPIGRGAAGRLFAILQDVVVPHTALSKKDLIVQSLGEVEPDMAGIAGPVFGADGRCRGVLTLSGPCSRFTPESTRHMKDVLWEAASQLTLRAGGHVDIFDDSGTGRAG